MISAAEDCRSPAMLQIHPSALRYGSSTLVALCLEAARSAKVPISVHLDHSTKASDISERPRSRDDLDYGRWLSSSLPR
ncbi:MAG UNVERIFIED_CONTAM: class II fructose-bisphosphate aldolase [Microcystis novacekii LVE1205-3]